MSESERGTGTMTMGSLSHSQLVSSNDDEMVLSRCANCSKGLASEDVKFSKIAGNEKWSHPAYFWKRGEDKTGYPKGNFGEGHEGDQDQEANKSLTEVGVAEAVLGIFGLPLLHDDAGWLEQWRREGEGHCALCEKCHGVVAAFYSAFQDFLRVADEASYLSKCIKSLHAKVKEDHSYPPLSNSGAKAAATTTAPRRKRGRPRKSNENKQKNNSRILCEEVEEVGSVPDRSSSPIWAHTIHHDDIKAEAVVTLDTKLDANVHDELEACDDFNASPIPSPLPGPSDVETENKSQPKVRTSLRLRKGKRQFDRIKTSPHPQPRKSSKKADAKQEKLLKSDSQERAEIKSEDVRKAQENEKSEIPCPKSKKRKKKRRVNNTQQNQNPPTFSSPPILNESEAFKCKHCQQIFLSEHSLDKHLNAVHKESSPQGRCAVCGQLFRTTTQLATHISDVHDKQYSCPDCPTTFRNPFDLEEHFQCVHNETLHLCKECGKSFTSSEYLYQHSTSVHSPTGEGMAVKVEVDNANQTGEGEPGERLRKVESISTAGKFKCRLCDKTFNKKQQLSLHIVFHNDNEPRFGCSRCPKKYTQAKSLRRHLLIHTMANPLACSICDKIFVRRDHLKRHKETVHSNRPKPARKRRVFEKKEYPCTECGKKLYRKEYLVQHMRTHTGEKPFMCSNCGKTFNDPRNLAQHLITHNNERPFCCSVCGLTFKRAHHLQDHEGMHRENIPRPFICSIPDCGKTFKLKKHLNSHMISHKGTKEHFCHVCGNAFSRKDNLRQHINNVHGKDLAADLLLTLLAQASDPLKSEGPQQNSSTVSVSDGPSHDEATATIDSDPLGQIKTDHEGSSS